MKLFGLMLGLVVVSLVFVDGVWAGPKHYVASYGNDANLCTLTSPCRSFSHAVDVTDAGGEVIVLDTGGYGLVTITKSISLIAPVGMYASVTVSSGTSGITINAAADDKVLIKGLTIKGTPGSYDGILAMDVGTLIVNDCFISGFGHYGIYFLSPDSELVILNSKIYGNNNGVQIHNVSGSVSVSMNNVELVDNLIGFYSQPSNTGSVSATVTNSLITHNQTSGFSNGYENSSGTSVLTLEHCIISGNGYGIYSENNFATDVTRLSNCTVTRNTNHGVYKLPGSSGTIYSRGNNTVVGNTIESNVTPTPFSAW